MRADPFSGAGAIRDAHRFDQARLSGWLEDNIPEIRGPLAIEQFRGGQSNPTYLLTTPNGKYVLRRKPPGTLLKGAHAVDREARVMAALGTVGFPVPQVHALCTDDTVIGSWFYVMEFVEGRIFWNPALDQVPRAERPNYFDAVNATIANLHSIKADTVELSDYGPRGGYLERQIRRWSKQYLEDSQAGRDPNMDWLVDWLTEHRPSEDETALIHGDFRIDNLIFHPTEPKIIAVLDWELSTLGHPLADFAYHLMMYRMPGLTIPGLGGVDLRALNIPTEQAYVDAYCARTNRTEVPDLDFHLAFNLFRFAAIIHGVKGRAMRGNAASAHASALIGDLPRIAQLARIAAEAAVTAP